MWLLCNGKLIPDGLSVGVIVGNAVGLDVVGVAVVGLVLGFDVGSIVGDPDGRSVGLNVGDSVGAPATIGDLEG